MLFPFNALISVLLMVSELMYPAMAGPTSSIMSRQAAWKSIVDKASQRQPDDQLGQFADFYFETICYHPSLQARAYRFHYVCELRTSVNFTALYRILDLYCRTHNEYFMTYIEDQQKIRLYGRDSGRGKNADGMEQIAREICDSLPALDKRLHQI